ncbi:MAG: GAF domain-containing protein [Planctomycetaceae bacterium]
MSDARKVLVVGGSSADAADGEWKSVLSAVAEPLEPVECADLQSALGRLAAEGDESIAAIVLDGGDGIAALADLARDTSVLASLPDAVAVVAPDGRIRWANDHFGSLCGCGGVAERRWGEALGVRSSDGEPADEDPVAAAFAGATAAAATIRTVDNRYFHLRAAPLVGRGAHAAVVVAVREVTHTILEQQKRAAIHHAGQQLADLTPAELASMSVDERIDLLKSNIIHYSRDLLQFDVVEIRLLDARTGRLEPLLAEGMQPEAEARVLYARPEHNGVTGYVASTGRSYRCNDTTKDPLYLEGCKGAKSSLTVPLSYHDTVIGTFNVESPEPGGFSTTDLQFLEIFARDVAVAINTLELLVAEKASTAAESIEAIHGAVALPVDDILNDAVNVMEKYIGHDADVVERLERILRNARDIKLVIQKVGAKMTPSSAHTQLRQPQRPRLVGRRILVVDANEQVRASAHSHLERCGCIVETARDGGEALSMLRGAREGYDIILSDIRLPDMTGYELLVRLLDAIPPGRFILMQEFGWDPGHSIVKARQAGSRLQLFKPFRVDQLLDTIDRAIQS